MNLNRLLEETEFVNPLCEYCLEELEIECEQYNALYEEYDELIPNLLFENNPSQSIVLPNGFVFSEVLGLIFEIRQHIVVLNPTKCFTFSGMQLVDYFLQKTISFPELGIGTHPAFCIEEDAMTLCQQLLDNYYIVSVPYSEFPIFSKQANYRFLEDEDPAFYKDVINVKPRHKFTIVKTRSVPKLKRNSLFQNRKSMDLGHKRGLSGDFGQVINQLQTLLDSTTTTSSSNTTTPSTPTLNFSQEEMEEMVCYYQTPCIWPSFVLQLEYITNQIFQFVNYQLGYIDFSALSNSEIFKQWISMSCQLRYMKLDWIESLQCPMMKLSFYANLMNLMMVHSLLIRGCASTKEARQSFFDHKFYFLEHQKVSLRDLLVRIAKEDPRIFFVVSFGYRSCPLPVALEQEQINFTIKTEAKSFLDSHVTITESSIELPFHLEMMYIESFNSCIVQLLNFIRHFFSPELKEKFDKLLAKFGWNIETLEEQASIDSSQELPFLCVFQEADYSSQRPEVLKRRKSKTLQEEEEEFEEEEEIKRITLEDVKRDLKLRSFFQKFCKLEYSEENILFFEQVVEFRLLKDPYLMHEMLKMIYDEFLSPTAPREVNVTKNMITTISDLLNDEQVLTKITPQVLDTLENEVELVLVDSYSRFEVSELYYEMVLFSQKQQSKSKSSKLAQLSKKQNRRSTVLSESPLKDAESYLNVTSQFVENSKKRQSGTMKPISTLFLDLKSSML